MYYSLPGIDWEREQALQEQEGHFTDDITEAEMWNDLPESTSQQMAPNSWPDS